jgi:predicted Zn-dependent protease
MSTDARSARTWAVLTCCAWLLTGCIGTGGVTVADEQEAGARAAQQVAEQVGIYPGEFAATYVDSIGRRLVATLGETPYYFKFRVIDQAEPNAFATPGGFIFVSRGLLALVNSEDELAGVLAHEISHVTLRHHARQATRGVLPSVLSIPGRAIGAVVGEDVGNIINAPLSVAGQAYLSSYSREQESEADDAGVQLVARAGYDPAALTQILANLERTIVLLTESAEGSRKRQLGFFDSHPTTPTRVADIETLAATIQWMPARKIAEDRAALYKRLDGLTWGPNNPMQGIFREQQFLQPDMNLTITFPAGWRTLNTPRYVGAVTQDERALILFGGPDRPGGARELATEFIAEISKAADIEPWEPAETQIGEWPAWAVKFDDEAGSEPASVYYVWINAGGNVLQVVALGPQEYFEVMRETGDSLRQLTEEELDSIVAERIRIATAESGETIAELSARSENKMTPDLTAAINGRNVSERLDAGTLVKILRLEPYLGN